MDSTTVSDSLRKGLEQAPRSSISVRGTHKIQRTNDRIQEDVVDFDLQIDCSKLCFLVKVVAEEKCILERTLEDVSPSPLQSDEIKSLSEACYNQLARRQDSQRLSGITILKSIVGIDDDALLAHVQWMASRIVYKGHIEVIVQNAGVEEQNMVFNEESLSSSDAEKSHAIIQTTWMCPLLSSWKADMQSGDGADRKLRATLAAAWTTRIQNGMVDMKHGWISLEDCAPRGAPFLRALQKHSLVRDAHPKTVQSNGLEMGGFDFVAWGKNE